LTSVSKLTPRRRRQTEKYFAWGWVTTMAEVDCSGSSWSSSVSETPISSALSSANSGRWSARLGRRDSRRNSGCRDSPAATAPRCRAPPRRRSPARRGCSCSDVPPWLRPSRSSKLPESPDKRPLLKAAVLRDLDPIRSPRRRDSRAALVSKSANGRSGDGRWDHSRMNRTPTITRQCLSPPERSGSSLDRRPVSSAARSGWRTDLPATPECRLRGLRPRVRRQVRLRFCPCRAERTRRCRDLADRDRSGSRQGPSGSGLPRKS
jgi:hypothetical protein